MDYPAVVTVNTTNRHNPGISCNNPLGGGVGGGGQVLGLHVNGPQANCLEVVSSGGGGVVDGLDQLLVAAHHQQQQQGLAPVAIVKSVVNNPRQLLHTLPVVVPLNPVTGLLHNSGGGGSNNSVPTNNNHSNLNNLMQLTGDHILTPTSTAAPTITTVKIEPSALGPQPVQLHPAGNPPPQQHQAAMTNKRNRMEV